MNAIVTTTINSPTEAIIRFCSKRKWRVYIVGDKSTPHSEYKNLNARYIHPDEQEKKYKNFSDIIGWNCIQRRNIGFIEAYKDGAEIIATVDDDNIPYDGWGDDLLLGKELEVDFFENSMGVFDPLSVTSLNYMWHRGYPIQLLSTRMNNKFLGKKTIIPNVQVDLWDGEPDIDSYCRISNNQPYVRIEGNFPFSCNGITVFNSQNTFFHRSIIENYLVIPGADRMDDIWGGIMLQKHYGKSLSIVFNKPSVCQNRNLHDLIFDLQREIPGYKRTLDIIQNGSNEWDQIYDCYRMNLTSVS